MAETARIAGRKKAAMLLISLGTELSALIFQNMEQSEIELLTLEIVRVDKIDADVRDEVLTEFSQMHLAHGYVTAGGLEYAEELLRRALGDERSRDILERVLNMIRITPFDSVRNTPPEQLLGFIENEHPQTIALILSYLPPEHAAIVLGGLPQEVQTDVAMRIALTEGTTPEVLKEISVVLERRVNSFGAKDFTEAGGIKPLVDILNSADRSTERAILDRLEEENPELAEEVRKSMFVFEDLLLLDDRSLSLILREIDTKDLAMALKAATEEIKVKFFKCMSERAASMLKEDMEFLGAVRLRSVEEAQQKIVTQVRKLEEAGQLQLGRGGKGEEFIT